MKAIARNPTVAGQFAPAKADLEPMGITLGDVVATGKRAFAQLSQAGYGLLCGGGPAQGGHFDALISTLGTNRTTITAGLATLLVAQLGFAPAIAGVVAALATPGPTYGQPTPTCGQPPASGAPPSGDRWAYDRQSECAAGAGVLPPPPVISAPSAPATPPPAPPTAPPAVTRGGNGRATRGATSGATANPPPPAAEEHASSAPPPDVVDWNVWAWVKA